MAIVEREVNNKKAIYKIFCSTKATRAKSFLCSKKRKKMVHRISTVGIVGNIVLTIFKQVA